MNKGFLYGFLCVAFIACRSGKELNRLQSKELNEKEKIAFGNFYMDGTREKLLGNYTKAQSFYEKALSIDNSNAAAHYELGLVHNYQKNYDQAFDQFKIATDLDPSNYWYKLSYASFLESNGDVNEAIAVFKELTEQNPSQIELKLELSKLLIGQRKYQEGIEILNKIEEETGINEEITFLKQKIYLYKNDVDGAANELEHLIQAYPNEIRYYGILSDIYLNNGREDQAYQVFKRMKSVDSSSYMVNLALADYYKKQGDKSAYMNELNMAFSNPEMNIDAKIQYILTNYRIDSRNEELKKEGIALCKTLTQTHPNDAKSHAIYADFLYFDNQLDLAKQAYFRTIELDSSRFPVWNQLMVILSETNENEALIKYGVRAIDLFPNQASSYLMLGFAHAQRNQHEKAVTYFNLGKDLALGNEALKAQFYASLGDSYQTLKQHDKSDQAYDKALEIDPDNVYVLNNYSYFLALRKDQLEKAKDMSMRSNNLAPGQSSFQDTYAWILFQMGNYEEANQWIDKALSNDSSSGVLLEHKGDILFQMGKIDEAIEFWKKAKEKGGTTKMIDRKIEDKKWYEED